MQNKAWEYELLLPQSLFFVLKFKSHGTKTNVNFYSGTSCAASDKMSIFYL